MSKPIIDSQLQTDLITLRRTLSEYSGDDIEMLRTRYPNVEAIMDRLRNINTDIGTFELLSEVFYNYILSEAESEMLQAENIPLYKSLREEVMFLYELARAAKALKWLVTQSPETETLL